VSYTYLGLSTVVIETYPQPGVELTYVKLSGKSNGDAGDQYPGLDRFGCQRAPQNQPPVGASKPASVSLRLSHV